MYPCDLCKKSFTAKKNLTRHFKSHVENETVLTCDKCDYTTSRPDNLKRHDLKAHSLLRTSSVIPCILCSDFSCHSRPEMLQHYKLDHGIIVEGKECFSFEKPMQFNEWKSKVEKEDKNHFVRPTKPTLLVDGKTKVELRCFRDGNFKSRKTDSDRYDKILGSNKINGYCPARMELTFFPSGKVAVE